MPYVFLHENLFIVVISVIIVGLLLLRMYLTHQRYRRPGRSSQQPGDSLE